MRKDDEIPHRTIRKMTIRSHYLAADRSLRIFLPPGYDPRISYPVVYCQDGEQYFNFGRIATTVEKLMQDEHLPPVVIVGVDVDPQLRTEEYSPDGERFMAYCAFFVEELLPFVESQLAVKDTAEGRIITGDSLGATVSLQLALLYPHLWRKVIAFSGAFFASTQQRIEAEFHLGGLELYMLVGLQETEVKTERGTFDFLHENRETHRLLTAKGAQVAYFEEEGSHLWGFWQKYMAPALRHFLLK